MLSAKANGENDLDLTCINTIRTLSMDAVQAANSGHPGTPMALAPVAYGLWQNFLRFDPQDPIWPNRDRFILSAGHASMLLYSLLHLTGVKAVSKDYGTLGERLRPRSTWWFSFVRVFTSPLQRAVRTCELAGFGSAAGMHCDLIEWDHGSRDKPVIRLWN